MILNMRRVILFSPNGYVGKYIKENILKEDDLQLYLITRDSDWEQYKEDYDIMIYSAAITSARKATAEKYVEDNVVTAVAVINFCKLHHIKRIIYLSSDEIYGEINTDIVTEKAIMVNPNLYAATKYLAEKIILDSKIPFYILRLPGIVGGIWGNSFINRLMDSIQKNEPIALYNMNRKFNNILCIDDLTGFIIKLCLIKSDESSQIFLLGNTEKIELEKIVIYIKELYHSISQISNIDTNNKRYFTLDVTKAVEYGYSSKKIKKIIDDLYQIQER